MSIKKQIQGCLFFHRRKDLPVTHYSGLMRPASMRELAEKLGCTEAALYLDCKRGMRWIQNEKRCSSEL